MKAAPLVAIFDGWGLLLIVSGDFLHVKFGPLRLVHQDGNAIPILVMAERGFDLRGAHPSKTATDGAALSVIVFLEIKISQGLGQPA
jgi:hypothetical protein